MRERAKKNAEIQQQELASIGIQLDLNLSESIYTSWQELFENDAKEEQKGGGSNGYNALSRIEIKDKELLLMMLTVRSSVTLVPSL